MTRSSWWTVACAALALATATTNASAGPSKPASWELRYTSKPVKGDGPGMSIDVFSDGRVIFSTAFSADAPTQATAPAALLEELADYVAKGKPSYGGGKA